MRERAEKTKVKRKRKRRRKGRKRVTVRRRKGIRERIEDAVPSLIVLLSFSADNIRRRSWRGRPSCECGSSCRRSSFPSFFFFAISRPFLPFSSIFLLFSIILFAISHHSLFLPFPILSLSAISRPSLFAISPSFPFF